MPTLAALPHAATNPLPPSPNLLSNSSWSSQTLCCVSLHFITFAFTHDVVSLTWNAAFLPPPILRNLLFIVESIAQELFASAH